MKDTEKIKQLLIQYEYQGLVEKNTDKLMNCLYDKILGLGIGEQGFITSKQEMENIYESILKAEDNTLHSIDFGRIEILIVSDSLATVCAEVIVFSYSDNQGNNRIKSEFQQSLTVIKQNEEWKICGFHASVPIVTEDSVKAFPVKFADSVINDLKEKIGKEAYLAEKQVRAAILSDTIAFYIINFTENRFEKCELNEEYCFPADDDTTYENFIDGIFCKNVYPEDKEQFLKNISVESINKAYDDNINQIRCEFRMLCSDVGYIWAEVVIRLITDVLTRNKKGIICFKNIDNEKLEVEKIMLKVDYDDMTKTLNKSAMIRKVNQLLNNNNDTSGGTLLMIDIDDFKTVNDTFGHPAGDKILEATAKIIKNIFGSNTLVSRLGGDEFGAFLHATKLDYNTKESIEHFLNSVRGYQLADIPDLKFSVSLGGAYLPKGTFEELYNLADKALYKAKKKGKNKSDFI